MNASYFVTTTTIILLLYNNAYHSSATFLTPIDSFHKRIHLIRRTTHQFSHYPDNVSNWLSSSTAFPSLESNVVSTIRTCNTCFEVQTVLNATSIHYFGTNSNIDEFTILGPNVASTALRKIVNVRPDFDHRTTQIQKDDYYHKEVRIASTLVPKLLSYVGQAVIQMKRNEEEKQRRHGRDNDELQQNQFQTISSSVNSSRILSMNYYSLVNILYSLSKLVIKMDDKYNIRKVVRPLADRVCETILLCCRNNDDCFIRQVGPIRNYNVLCSMATLHMSHHIELLQLISNRLKEGDATGKFTGRQLALGLSAHSKLERPQLGLLKAFMRRLRKGPVRKNMESTDICLALRAVAKSIEQLTAVDNNYYSSSFYVDGHYSLHDRLLCNGVGKGDEGETDDELNSRIATLWGEAKIMSYTLVGELLSTTKERFGTEMNEQQICLKSKEIADILSSCAVFQFNQDGGLLNEISRIIKYDIDQYSSVGNIARILSSFHKLKMNDEKDTITALVQQFITLLETHAACDPKSMNVILSSVVLLLSPDDIVVRKLHRVVSSILLSDDSFLSQSNDIEISGFIWFLAKANIYDKELLYTLAFRMRDEELIANCLPSSASRFLWSFTTLIENSKEEDWAVKEVLFETFQILRSVMLSDRLTSVDISCTMWAMAKSSYVLDLDLFVHLAETLAGDTMIKRANTMQISKALWSCGKMLSCENPGRSKKYKMPPYILSARIFLSHLASVNDQMTPKDVTQSCWVLGHVKENDMEVLHPIASSASSFARKELLNSQEISNILWGLSKADFKDKRIIGALTNQIRRPALLERCTTQEASNILYALATMNIRDKSTFDCMNNVILENLSETTSQAIANVLWAHDCVRLKPKRQLFDKWARQKVGVVDLYLKP